MYFDKHVILLNSGEKTREEVLTSLANKMFSENVVNSHFLENVLEREKKYATGLLVNGIGLAIPHTDSDYVITSQLGFMSLKEPVIFNQMGTLDDNVEVKLVFMLALKEAHEQLNMLQRLIEIFQNEEIISKLIDVDTEEKFIEIMSNQNLI